MNKGKIRSRFTNEEVLYSVEKATREDGTVDYKRMSVQLSCNPHGTQVSAELCKYWAKQFLGDKHDNSLASTNRSMLSRRTLRLPSEQDDKALFSSLSQDTAKDCILVIPDLHSPYHHPDALDFLIEVNQCYNPDAVVCLGDEADHHALSYHDSDPNLDSAGMELEKARAFMKLLALEFPDMLICHSNHGSMLHRKAKSHGIPVQMIKSYREILFPEGGGDGWEWADSHKLKLPNGDTVLFKHQASGSILSAASHERTNLVLGHLHSTYQIMYAASSSATYWGVYSGCLVDKDSLAFSYGKNFKDKPVLGCTIILDSLPYLVPMRLNEMGRWVGKL